MNSNDKILEVLLKINESLDEIKTQMRQGSAVPVADVKKVESTVKQIEQVATPVVSEVKKSEPAAKQPEKAQVEDFYLPFIEKFVKPTLDAGKNLGDKFTPICEIIDSLFCKLLHDIIKKSFVCRKPADADMNTLFAPVKECNDKLNALNKDRDFPLNYVKCMYEIVTCVNWVVIPEEPAEFVTQTLDSATFWMNKIRREARDKMDKKPQEFCNSLIAMVKELINIINDRYKEGFTWKENGVDIKEFKEEAPAAEEPVKDKAASIRDELASLYAKRKGDGHLDLKHVEKDQMSHKNPSLRGNVKMVEKNEKAVLTKPPRCELVQTKWMVENQVEKCEVNPKLNETIYILGCVGATIRVNDKCKSIIVDGCKKTNVIFDKCISTCEVVNCKQCKIQSLVSVPTVAVDKTDGCTIYFPRSCIDSIRILTSKCSDMNVSFPSANDEQEWVEKAIPEQFVHTIQGDQVKTNVSDLYSS